MELLEHVFRAKQAEYLIALAGLFAFIGFWRVLNGPAVELAAVRARARAMAAQVAGFLVPEGVRYHPGHAWVRLESGGLVTVGLDDFAGKLLGRAEALHLPPAGARIEQGGKGWTIKSDSRLVDMLAPVDGEIVAVNAEAASSPRLAFADPYGKGWLLKVRSSNLAANLKNLIPAEMVSGWFENIRESIALHQAAPELAVVYQDGGVPIEGIAKALDPERWDEVAARYLLTDAEADAEAVGARG